MGGTAPGKLLGISGLLILLTALPGRAAAQAPPGWAGASGEDPSGNWTPRFDEDWEERIPGPEIGDYLGLPINAAARLRGDAWDAALIELQHNQCRQHASDYGWRGPSNLSIWQEVDRATQRVIAYHTHLSAYGAEQTIWMDGRPHPSKNAPHDQTGFTTGVWNGNELIATTTHLKTGYMRRNGAASSDQATITTHFRRHGDMLTLTLIMEDPVYLTEPYILTRSYNLSTNPVAIGGPPCIVGDEGVESGRVPHYLPGKNPFLDETMKRYGIPPEAALGGAETMYPEYREKIKAKFKRPEKCTINCG